MLGHCAAALAVLFHLLFLFIEIIFDECAREMNDVNFMVRIREYIIHVRLLSDRKDLWW